jgi:hypothetical protein
MSVPSIRLDEGKRYGVFCFTSEFAIRNGSKSHDLPSTKNLIHKLCFRVLN